MTRGLSARKRSLTPRQRQIIGLLIADVSRVDVGRRLGISERTVEMHLARARERLGVATNAALFARAGARLRPEHDEGVGIPL